MTVTTPIPPDKSVPDPQLYDAMQTLKTDIFRSLNCVKVGQIQTFDPMRLTAEVQILFMRVLPDGSTQSLPILVDCPVFTPQGGGGALAFPIEPGDQCLVLFSDRNLDAWFQNGAAAPPFDARCHNLSDGLVLVGVNALTSASVGYSPLEAVLSYATAQVSLKGGQIALANATTDLLTVLTQLITILTALNVGIAAESGTIPTAATAATAANAALVILQTTLNTLLYTPV